MADYYINFSLIIKLPTEAAKTYAVELAKNAAGLFLGDEIQDPLPASIVDVVEDWQFETEPLNPADGWGLWLHSENGGIDAVSVFIQHLLQEFDQQGRVAFEWSNDCSKPCVDAYGGGAVIITAWKIKSMATHQWLHKQHASITVL